jgi:hypothetical protein
MGNLRVAIAVTLAAGCGAVQDFDDFGPERPLGADEHLEEAVAYDDAAAVHERAAADAEARARQQELVCGDRVLESQASSGGERLLIQSPCWSSDNGVARHRQVAARLRADAKAHRLRAQALREAEQHSCAMTGAVTGETAAGGPFAQVVGVEAIVEGGEVRGARIRMRATPGGAALVERAIACDRARAAVIGWVPDASDPTLLENAEVSVLEMGDGSTLVIVRSADEATALSIVGRAEALLEP